jgi:hypothetical protein
VLLSVLVSVLVLVLMPVMVLLSVLVSVLVLVLMPVSYILFGDTCLVWLNHNVNYESNPLCFVTLYLPLRSVCSETHSDKNLVYKHSHSNLHMIWCTVFHLFTLIQVNTKFYIFLQVVSGQ